MKLLYLLSLTAFCLCCCCCRLHSFNQFGPFGVKPMGAGLTMIDRALPWYVLPLPSRCGNLRSLVGKDQDGGRCNPRWRRPRGGFRTAVHKPAGGGGGHVHFSRASRLGMTSPGGSWLPCPPQLLVPHQTSSRRESPSPSFVHAAAVWERAACAGRPVR